jgi:hypothetical protein
MKLEIERYYLNKTEPIKNCLITVHNIIIKHNNKIKSCWKYKMPFFCINDKMLCYLWINKKTKEPYIGFVDGNLINHSKLIQGNRNRMKILPINPNIDIPIKLINELLKVAITLKNKKAI